MKTNIHETSKKDLFEIIEDLTSINDFLVSKLEQIRTISAVTARLIRAPHKDVVIHTGEISHMFEIINDITCEKDFCRDCLTEQ